MINSKQLQKNLKNISKLRINSKAQAAVEYLINYSWAFLTLLIFIGVLMYFDVFNAERYATQYCIFDANFFCNDYSIEADTDKFNMRVLLQNNMNKEVVINQTMLRDENGQEIICADLKIYCRFNEIVTSATATPSNVKVVTTKPEKWIPTRLCKLDFQECDMQVFSGTKERISIRLNFSGVNNTQTHLSQGVVFASVQSKT
ncbi:hypothetical protein HQ533_05505 [Candidatus Woesearchaeota archaeon]|nr:hypothetical protein [Candidatus Woesearchaeota archaeon]